MTPARKQPDTTTYAGRFAVRLKTLREKAGLTPLEVSESLGLNSVVVYHWESARNLPKIANFPELAKLYKVKKAKDLLPNE
jgi:transcriptional regulator with XRE-family HTH domain